MSDYETLLNAPEKWLHRSDLGALAPEFIAEANSLVRTAVVAGHEIVRTTWSITDSVFALPEDWVSFTSVPLTRMSAEVFHKHAVSSAITGSPSAFTVDGRSMIIAPPPVDYSLEVSYRSLKNVDETNTTNWILTSHPELYRHAVLCAACDYSQDMEKLAYHEAKFQARAKEINTQQQWASQ